MAGRANPWTSENRGLPTDGQPARLVSTSEFSPAARALRKTLMSSVTTRKKRSQLAQLAWPAVPFSSRGPRVIIEPGDVAVILLRGYFKVTAVIPSP